MGSAPNICHPFRVVVCVLGVLWIASASGRSQGLSLESAGARTGFSFEDHKNFMQAEAFATWKLPWSWDLWWDWELHSSLEASAGWLGGHGANGAIVTLGPLL